MNGVGICRILGQRGPVCASLRIAALIVVVALAAVGTACNGAREVPDLPDLPDVPQLDFNRSTGAETPVPSPTLTAPAPTPASVAAPDGETVVRVPRLALAEATDGAPAYSRSDWKHWTDGDGDCQDTRAEVLIEESATFPVFATGRGCRVITGSWVGPYTGKRFGDAGDLDIDHLVPLKNAHLSGGWRWDADRKEDFANSMEAGYHLIAVDKRENRAKGARGPEEWQPPDESYHCLYALDWIAVKDRWGLTATAAEWAALEEMLARCPVSLSFVEGGSAIDLDVELAGLRETLGGSAAVAGPKGMPAAAGAVDVPPGQDPRLISASGPLFITEIMPDPSAVRDAAGEWFEVYNPNPGRSINLEGWTIRDGGRDEHRIGAGVLAPPGGYLALGRNSDEGINGGIVVDYEYHGITLNNEEDAIELVDGNGSVIDRVSYGPSLVFPGASMSLDPEALDSPDLDEGANDGAGSWCQATTAMDNGDYGTPGERNDPC